MDDFRVTVEQAANLRAKSDDAVSLEEFWQVYPQFSALEIDSDVIQLMLDNANAAVQKNRWHSRWKLGVCLYAAHLITLYLKTYTAPENSNPASVKAAGEARGNMTSKSVGGVSVGYGSSDAVPDLTGYGSLKDTVYGQQFASMARLVGRGMMVVR